MAHYGDVLWVTEDTDMQRDQDYSIREATCSGTSLQPYCASCLRSLDRDYVQVGLGKIIENFFGS